MWTILCCCHHGGRGCRCQALLCVFTLITNLLKVHILTQLMIRTRPTMSKLLTRHLSAFSRRSGCRVLGMIHSLYIISNNGGRKIWIFLSKLTFLLLLLLLLLLFIHSKLLFNFLFKNKLFIRKLYYSPP